MNEHTTTTIHELPLMLTVTEASHVLRVGKAATYSLVRSGQLKSLRIGNSIRVPKHALEDYLRSYAQ